MKTSEHNIRRFTPTMSDLANYSKINTISYPI